jgi:hypothetical protein
MTKKSIRVYGSTAREARVCVARQVICAMAV